VVCFLTPCHTVACAPPIGSGAGRARPACTTSRHRSGRGANDAGDVSIRALLCVVSVLYFLSNCDAVAWHMVIKTPLLPTTEPPLPTTESPFPTTELSAIGVLKMSPILCIGL
jgi:hypothetical protein